MKSTTNRRQFLTATGTAALGITMPGSSSHLAAQDRDRNLTRELDEFVNYDATGLADLIKKKEVTPSELVEVFIRRIETINPIINCIATPTFERARAKAKTIPSDTVFAGVPSLIKDMIDIGGVRRTDGSRLLATNIPQKSVAWIEAFERAGST